MDKVIKKYSDHPLRSWFIRQSLDYSKRTIIFSILLTLIIGSGAQFFLIDDDMIKLLPKNLDSRVSWDSIQDEFGSTEVILVAFGKKGESVFNPETMATLWDLTEAIENTDQVEELTSISSSTRMDNIDGFMEIDDLQPYRDLTQKEVNNIDLEELDNELVDEIKSSCKQILETLTKEEKLSVEVDHSTSSEDEELTLEVESSDGSFENLSSIDKDS